MWGFVISSHVISSHIFSNKMNVGVNSLVCDYSVHAVSSKCLDQILFINKDRVFNVMKGF